MSHAITYVTGNRGKVTSLQKVLRPRGITVLQNPLDVDEYQFDSVELISQRKARDAYTQLQTELVVQDSGFFIDQLKGFPGPYAKYVNGTLGVQGIIDLLRGKQNRKCYFLECLSYTDGTQVKTFKTKIAGEISYLPEGNNMKDAHSDLHRIFVPEGTSFTLANMSEEQRDEWRDGHLKDHYGVQFAEWYCDR